MRSYTKSKNIFSTFVYVFAVIWSVITLYPLFVTVMSSFKNNQEIFGKMFTLPLVWRIENYYDAIFGANIGQGIVNSLLLSLGTTAVVVAVSMLASYVLARMRYRFIKAVFALFMTGVMLPVHTTLIPIAKIAAEMHGTNSFLYLIFVYSAFNLSQGIFLATGYIRGIDRELDEAAIIDGCSMPGVLLRIILPISKPIVSTIAVLTFIYGYSELIFSTILITDKVKYPISRSLMYFTGDKTIRMGPVFASIVLAVIPMVCIYLLFHENVQKGMVAGAVKG